MTAEALYTLLTTDLPAGTTLRTAEKLIRDDIRRISNREWDAPKCLWVGYEAGPAVNVLIRPDGTVKFFCSQFEIAPHGALALSKFLEEMSRRLRSLNPLVYSKEKTG